MRVFHQFLEMMARERSATRATLSAYETDLQNFYEFFRNQKAEEVTTANIQDYLSSQSHLSSRSVARRISTLRQFYAYLVNRGVTKENPFVCVKVTHLKTKSFSSLSAIHVKTLWEGVHAWIAPEGKRLFLLFHILRATNWSVKEIVSLSLTQVNDVPSIEDILQEYLSVRPCFLAHEQESPWLFPSSSQKGHLTPQRFGQLLKERGVQLGIDPTLISLSTFRAGLGQIKKI